MGVPVHTQPCASRVLYIRNIAEKMTESDLVRYCMCFGEIPEVLLYPEKRHGFIQFANVNQAQACLDFYTEHALAPHGPKLEFAFSGRDEITHKRDPALNPPNRILIVTVSQVTYPVTVDVMQQIVQPFTDNRGMQRCVIFNRQDVIQALVELWTLEDAVEVRRTLDGCNIYPGCNNLKVQFSSMSELHVKANNTKAFDFTLEERKAERPEKRRESRRKESVASAAALIASNSPPVLVVENVNTSMTKVEDLAALFAVYGNVTRVQLLWPRRRTQSEPGTALVYMQDHLNCAVAQMHLHAVPLHGYALAVQLAPAGYQLPEKRKDTQVQSRDFKDMPTYNRHKGDKVAKMYPPGPALHVSNMPDNTSAEVVLGALQNAGAQVRNFKFLDNLNHIAVVLCASLENAVEAITRAHNVPIGHPARPMRVGFGAFRP